jgi:heptaprenyl diphosphate synthase
MVYYGRKKSKILLKNSVEQRYNNGSVIPACCMLYFRHCLFGGYGMNLLMSRYQEELSDVIDQVYLQAKNEFMQSYVDLPAIPVGRMQVLFLFLYDCNLPLETIKSYLLSTVLVQMGLDCHEEVSLIPQVTEKGVRTRQLSVLAGDFFSSKYYFLLSKIEDVQLVRLLANSIRKINEIKTEVYLSDQLNADQYLELMNEIDSCLYEGFVSPFGAQHTDVWELVMRRVAAVERLADEMSTFKLGGLPKGYLMRQLNKLDEEDVLNSHRNKMSQFINDVYMALDQFQNEEIKAELRRIMGAYQKDSNIY